MCEVARFGPELVELRLSDGLAWSVAALERHKGVVHGLGASPHTLGLKGAEALSHAAHAALYLACGFKWVFGFLSVEKMSDGAAHDRRWCYVVDGGEVEESGAFR